jgi:hypothetical protein
VKKHRVLIDGQKLEEDNFTTEVAGSMGLSIMWHVNYVEISPRGI